MKFGLGLLSMQTHPDTKATHRELYAQALDLAKLAESSGFHSVWLSEHHFLPDGYCPSVLATASAMAAVTSTIRLGTGVLLLPLHNPVRVAEDAAVVDNISGGRLDLGVAIGYRKEEFDGFGIPIQQRPSRIEEGIEVLLKAWGEESFTYSGKRYEFNDINVTPKPVQKPVPIYIGAFETPAIRRAGRLGYPLLIGPGRTMGMVADTIDTYNDASREAGKNPDDVEHILLRETYVHSDPLKAKEDAEKYIIGMYRYYFTLGVKIVVRGRQIQSEDDPLFEHLSEDRFVIGSPEKCGRELERYRDEMGIKHVTCRMYFPQAEYQAVADCVGLFGREVIANIK